MKRLALIAAGTALFGLLASCGAGFAAVSAGESGLVIALRDVGIMFLAVLYLIGSLIAAGIFFGGAWALERYGGKAVTGMQWVVRKVLRVEDLISSGMEKVAVRPVARTARYFTSVGRFITASATGGERAGELGRQRDAAIHMVSSLARQARRSGESPT